jgi:hypothetical protein
MPAMSDVLVKVATNANFARLYRENPAAVIAGAGLSSVEESVLLSRDPRQIQSALQASALKSSLAAADGDTVWTVIVVL